jgi:D-alanyl-D-alanine carboxypeptidase
MKKFIIFLIFISASNIYADINITAKSAIIMNSENGEVIYSKNPFMKLPPASTTKIMTAILVIEHKSLNSKLRVSSRAISTPPSKLYLRKGQFIRVRDLLYSLLLKSANDAAIVLAEGVAGSVGKFADMMNKKAREIGAFNTHFVNPHGLSAYNHYSTAYDLAIIFRYAMKNTLFKNIVHTKVAKVRIRKRKVRFIRNHNKLLWIYKGARGGKTGYTRSARHCFVGEVKKGKVSFIISLLGSEDIWGDARKILEYGSKIYSDGTEEPLPPNLETEDINSYILQVASFRNKKRALRLKGRLIEKGYNTYIVRNRLRGKIFYRVMVGEYDTLSKAKAEVKKIHSEEKLKPIVTTD